MPRLPDASALGARRAPNGQKAIATYDDSALTNAADRLGQTMLQQGRQIDKMVGIEQEKAAREADEQAINEARRKLNDWELQNVYDPEKGAMSKRGRDAFELPKTLTETYDAFAAELAKGLGSDRQKNVFNELAISRRQQIGEWASRYAGKERETFMEGQYQADLQSSQDRVALLANDPVKVSTELELAKQRILSYRSGKGRSPEEISQELRQFESKSHASALSALINSDDIAGAEKYLGQFGAKLELEDGFRFGQIIKKERETREALSVADEIVSRSGITRPVSEGDRLLDILIGQESGGKHYGKDGKLLTSPVGARGITQVMPKTGADPGYGIKPLQNETEAEYRRFGRDYLNAMLKEFGYDLPMALAAYNAGPGAVKNAVRMAKNAANLRALGKTPPAADTKAVRATEPKDGSSWLDFLPQETQQYVANISAKYEAGAGQNNKPSVAELKEQARIRLGGNPRKLKLALDEIDSRVKEAEEAEKQRNGELLDEAYKTLHANGGNFEALPVRIRANLPGDKLDSVMSFAKSIRSGEKTETDWNLYAELRRQAVENPAAFAKEDLTRYFTKLDPSKREQILDLQKTVSEGGSSAVKDVATLEQQLSNAHDLLKIRSKDMDTRGKFDSAVYDAINVEQQRLGKKLSFEERQKVIDRMMIDGEVTSGSWYKTDRNARYFEIAGTPEASKFKAELPEADIQRITERLKQRGINNPTPSQISAIFMAEKGL